MDSLPHVIQGESVGFKHFGSLFIMASPPPGLLTLIKTEMVNFFWDALHWVPQAVLFLSCDEISHFYLALMILFIQRFLTGATDLMWR